MPELPDVEVFRRYLNATSLHKKIDRVIKTPGPEILERVSGPELEGGLEGNSFTSGLRHGKYLFAGLEGGRRLVLHFGMTGFLKYFKREDHAPSHPRLVVAFENGYRLAYDCRRKLGKVGLTRDVEGFIREKNLGPDALDPGFDFTAFRDAALKSRAAVKSFLMDQSVIAGVGNVYSDEILFQAGVDPRATAGRLGEKTLGNIYRIMREEVLPTAIEKKARPEYFPSTFLTPRRELGAKCPKCSGRVRKLKVSGRSARFCPGCQRTGSRAG